MATLETKRLGTRTRVHLLGGVSMSTEVESARQPFRDLLEIVVFVAVVVADARHDAFGWVPITQTIYLLPLIALVMVWRREPRALIGFVRPQRLGRTITVGVVLGLAMELFAILVTTPLLARVFGADPNVSELGEIRGNVALLVLFLTLSWTLAAFGEEICFRGFLMQRLARLGATFGGGERGAWIVSLFLSSVLFGWGHTEQGVSGWLQEGLNGLLLGILFLRTGKNLAVPIVAHGVSNTLAFVLIYFGRYPGVG